MKASVSTVSLLLKNVHLLEIPGLPPDEHVTVETLTSGKNKSKVFEHVTHHLFNLYDPGECESRFQACWPVFEPAQAKVFRSVALSWFSDLKKTGQLPGSTVVRKSTLEDCQGERYEELMLAFSTMVLRSVLESTKTKKSTVYKLATDDRSTIDELQPLILAHQSFLSNVLRERVSEKTRWAKFQDLLSEEDGKLEERHALQPETAATPVLSSQEKSIFQRWKGNWVTDESLLNELTSGGHGGELNGLFRPGFSNALKAMGCGEGGESAARYPEAVTLSPAESLRVAVSSQDTRLERWRDQLSHQTDRRDGPWKTGSGALKSNETLKSVGGQVNFEKHQNLSVFDSVASHVQDGKVNAMDNQTQLEVIMNDFEAELVDESGR